MPAAKGWERLFNGAMALIDVVIDVARLEERLIVSALREAVEEVRVVNASKTPLILGNGGEAEAAVIRTISMVRALYAASAYEAMGSFTVNAAEAIMYSGDKVLAYTRLASHKLPLPQTVLALGKDAALEAAASLGYPVVMKPPIGSWGRLVARARNPDELVALLAHREEARTPHQRATILQEYINSGSRDIRCIVIGDEVLGCIERRARKGEWRSNVALGAETRTYPVNPELEDLVLRAATAVKGFFVSIDLFETRDGFLVNEVNAVPEFKGFMRATGLNPAKVLAKKLREKLRA